MSKTKATWFSGSNADAYEAEAGGAGGFADTENATVKCWWRRRESNPRPKMLLVKRLHAYSRSCPRHYPGTFAARAQNGQETRSA